MKRGRILSLFLSVVLLASAIIPCLQLSVNADKANAISEIKTAWNQLEYKILEGFKASKNSDGDTNWNIPLTETTTDEDKANFGSYKFTINAANANKGFQWYLVNPSKANFLEVMPPEDMGDIYLNVSSNKEVNVRIGYRVDFSYKDAASVTKTHYTVIYSDPITVPGDGTVTKLSGFKDLANFQDVAKAYVDKSLNDPKHDLYKDKATDVTLTEFENVRLFITQSDFTGDAELTVGMGMVINNKKPNFPAELNDSEDLVAIIDAAEDAVKSEIYTEDSKTALQTAIVNAWTVVKSDKELLVKALQNGWNDLVKNEETVLPMAAYNKTGLNPDQLNLNINQTSGSNYIKDSAGNPLNDAAHSGLITTKVCTTEEDIANFGNSYAELRREDPDVVGKEPDFKEDIPSLTVGDVILNNQTTVSYSEDITSLFINLLSTKKLKIGYKVWFDPVGNEKYAATETQYVDVLANTLTNIDLKAILNDQSLTRGKEVDIITGMAFYISEIDGTVTDGDWLKIGSVLSNPFDQCPLTGDVSLATIYNKASSLDFTQYVDNAAKTRFQELLNAAQNLIRAELLQKFETKEELIDVVTNEIWPSLVKKEPLDIKYFERYNSSGDKPNYSENWIKDGDADPENLDASRVGVTDAASSGNTVLLNSNEEQQKKFGNNYVRLTTQKFQDGATELNDNKDNDIPYLDTKHSVVVTPRDFYPIEGLDSLEVTVNSSMAMTLGCKVWLVLTEKADKEGGSGKTFWDATNVEQINVKQGYNTIDLMSLVEKRQAQLDGLGSDEEKYKTEITDVIYVAIGIKSMAETPDNDDYLEIGNVRGRFCAVLPDELKSDVNAIKLYDAMQKLNLDEYIDGEAKENFIFATEAAKIFSEQEWEEIYNDQDRLALVIKNQLWPKLTRKVALTKEFRYYNSTGKNLNGIDYRYNLTGADAPAGTGTNASGLVWGTWANAELNKIYGNRYYRLTTTKTNPSAAGATDRDIPYLGEEIVVISLGPRDNPPNLIDVPGSNAIYMYVNSSMKMSAKMRIWYYKPEDADGNGKYDDWGAVQISFNIEKGLNKIDIKKLLVDNNIDTKMKYIHYTTFNAYNYEHTPTDSDFLEIGSIGNEAYETVPRKLANITALSAIIREAGYLNMDDYVDNADKTMFQNAVARGIQLLNNLDVNLTEHVPVEVYETDASGKRTKLGEDKFGYDEQAKLYDGDTENNPVELDVKNKKLDIIFNLNDKMKLYDIRAYLAENNVKDMKIYTAPVREAIWNDSGLVYQYDGTDSSTLDIGRSFSTPIENQYVRFSFNEVDGDTLKLTEIKCIGKGIQQLAYTNIIEGKTDVMSYANVDYDTKKSQFIRFESNKFGDSLYQFTDANVAHDGYLDTVVDFCGGSRSENQTYNIVFDLNGLSAVDNIKYYAGSNPEYFPRKMKFYIGNDQMNILDNSNEATVCVAEFNGATTDENGLYEAKFLAQNAAYVRIELIEDGAVSDDGRYGDNLLAVARDIQINGLSLNASMSDAVKSFTDAETGIIVDILKFNEGDIYETVQGMKLTKRKPTAAETQQAGDFGFVFKDWFYTVTLLNYRGDPVTDVEGREIRVSVPLDEGEDMDTSFMATILGDEVVLMEHELRDINDKYYITVFFDDPVGLVFARGNIDDDFVPELPEEEFEDDYEDEDEDYYDEEDYDDDYDDDEEEEEEDDTSNPKRKKYYKVIKKGGGLSTGAIVGIVAGSVVAVSGGSLLIIFRKKIFKPRIKKPKV
jgi:hypothetical protein